MYLFLSSNMYIFLNMPNKAHPLKVVDLTFVNNFYNAGF